MSVIVNDKGLLMRAVLDYLGVAYNPGRSGRQQINCPGPMHVRGDKRPSASLDLLKGRFRCFGCGLAGDGYDLLKELEGLTFKQVNDKLELDSEVANQRQDEQRSAKTGVDNDGAWVI